MLAISNLSAVIVISLVQCSSKKVEIKDVKDKDDKEAAKIPVPQEQIKDKQEKAVSPEEKIKAEEPHTSDTETITSRKGNQGEFEERIAKGKETRGKGDYPTMDDVLSDWDSEKDGKKKDKEDDDQKSKAITNLEDVDESRKNEEQKPMESGAGEDKEGISEKKEADSKKSDKRDSKRSVGKVEKTARSQVK
ncbi:hypothetical protein X798_02039, partial [Onchocerca flexuosa]